MKNFIGTDGYIWWYGVIENRNDPLKLGRVQVRCHGFHHPSKTLLPTEDLFWASCEYPLNDPNPKPPMEGSWVKGHFLDGMDGQFPVVSSWIPGIPESIGPRTVGYNDPRTDAELQASPRPPASVEYQEGGVQVQEQSQAQRFPYVLNEPQVSRIARNENITETIIQTKKNVVTGVEEASGGTWSEPVTPYNTVYPFNKVWETESGHIIEYDDTPGAERLHFCHRTGTFIEFYPDGSLVTKIGKNEYRITLGNENIVIQGSSTVTIEGDGQLYCQGDYTLKVDGNLEATVEGNLDGTINGNATITSNQVIINTPTVEINGDLTVNGTTNISGQTSTGPLSVTGPIKSTGVITGGKS